MDHIEELERRLEAGETWEHQRHQLLREAGAPTSGKGNPTHFGNIRFSGTRSESIKFGFHPNEVSLARQSMPEVADCIRDDGRVQFKDSRTAKKFEKAMDRTLQRAGHPTHPF